MTGTKYTHQTLHEYLCDLEFLKNKETHYFTQKLMYTVHTILFAKIIKVYINHYK